jgi:hypothetical protein
MAANCLPPLETRAALLTSHTSCCVCRCRAELEELKVKLAAAELLPDVRGLIQGGQAILKKAAGLVIPPALALTEQQQEEQVSLVRTSAFYSCSTHHRHPSRAARTLS